MIRPCTTKNRKALLEYLKQRFGLDKKQFNAYALYEDQKGRIFLGTKNLPTNLKTQGIGMHIAKIETTIKPSTNLIQLFGKHMTKNKIELSKEQTIAFIAGEDIEIQEKEPTQGYVATTYKTTTLGCAHYKNGRLKNMLPKGKRIKVEYL